MSVLEPSPQAAMTEATRLADELGAVLDGLAIPREAWTTSGVGVSEQRDWERDRQVHRGYRATYQVSVRLAEHELVGRLMREAIERARADVGGPWWRVDPDNPARMEACRRAASNARNKAQAYTEALGSRLGAAVAVTEPEISVGPGTAFLTVSRSVGPASADMDVEPGELDVTATVDVTFRLEAA